MLILQQHLTLVTTINTQGGGKKKPLTGLPGSCFCTASQAPSQQWLSSCTSQAGTDHRGCLQSSTRREEGSRMAGRGKQLSSDIDSQLGSKTETQEQRAAENSSSCPPPSSPPPSPTLKLWEHL